MNEMLETKQHTKYYHELLKETDPEFLKAFHYYSIITLHKVIGEKDGWYPSHSYESLSKAIGKTKNTLMNWVRKCQSFGMMQKKGTQGFATISYTKILKKRGYEKYEHKNKKYYAYRKNNVDSVKKCNYLETHVLNLIKQLYNQQQYIENKSNTKGFKKEQKNCSDDVSKLTASLRYMIVNSPLLTSLSNSEDDRVSRFYKTLKGLKKKQLLKIKKNKDFVRMVGDRPFTLNRLGFNKFFKNNHRYTFVNGIIYEKGRNTYIFNDDLSEIDTKTESKNFYSSDLNERFQHFVEDNKMLFFDHRISKSMRKVSYRQYNAIISRSVKYLLKKFAFEEIKKVLKEEYSLFIDRNSVQVKKYDHTRREVYIEFETKYSLLDH